MFKRLASAFKALYSRPQQTATQKVVVVNARYDAAQTNNNNSQHWVAADGLSAASANSESVRKTLRNRARYERANNSYADGIVQTLANDTIGNGPRLQILNGKGEARQLAEKEFMRWAYAVRLAEKLRTMRMSKCVDGESLAFFVSNPGVNHPVKLDLRLVEAEQVASPLVGTVGLVEGIGFDSAGMPAEYCVLKQHPGDGMNVRPFEHTMVPASAVIHYFRADRPGQIRGIPELTPALPLFGMLRSYTLATLDAARLAACFAGILHSDSPADAEDQPDPLNTVEIKRNLLVTLPGGWNMSQLKAEQPTGTYAEFKREILNEIARCLNVPFNIAACNSSSYNYASGRLDHQTYDSSIAVERGHLGAAVLDRIFDAWVAEAVLIEGYLPQEMRSQSFDWTHQWLWQSRGHADPTKEANSIETNLRNFNTSLAIEWGRRGQDYEQAIRQIGYERRLLAEQGLQLEDALPLTAPTPPDDQVPEDANVGEEQ